jgi:hypothetical protein
MKNIYFGMTGKERLYIGGLSNDFDTCEKKKMLKELKLFLRKMNWIKILLLR